MRPIDDSDLIKMLGWWVQGHEDEVFTGKDIEKEMMSMIRQAPTIPVQYPVRMVATKNITSAQTVIAPTTHADGRHTATIVRIADQKWMRSMDEQ